MNKALGLLLAFAVAFTATSVLNPDQAGAKEKECAASGIVPDSSFIVSSSNRAGQISGHVVWFQLCIPVPSNADDENNTPTLTNIALLWSEDLGRGFYLNEPDEAGISLRLVDGEGRWWAANNTPSHCGVGFSGEGVAVNFTSVNGDTIIPASMDSPLTLQFVIPVEAGMINPLSTGKYSWALVTYFQEGNQVSIHENELRSTILKFGPEIRFSDNFGHPGNSVTIHGTGFNPTSPLISVKLAGIELKPFRAISTDKKGSFTLEVLVPGVEEGPHPLLVQVGDVMTVDAFTVTSGGSPPYYWKASESFEDLGDNLDVVFHFNSRSCQWTFYDPEFPSEGDLIHVFKGERYWIRVKQSAEVILGYETRHLTCSPEGDCWNQIVW